ncbi:unnamed protein product, partial [Acanthoscelides obtectus]
FILRPASSSIITPYDHYLFRSSPNCLQEHELENEGELQKVIGDFTTSNQAFHRLGIHKLSERGRWSLTVERGGTPRRFL